MSIEYDSPVKVNVYLAYLNVCCRIKYEIYIDSNINDLKQVNSVFWIEATKKSLL